MHIENDNLCKILVYQNWDVLGRWMWYDLCSTFWHHVVL